MNQCKQIHNTHLWELFGQLPNCFQKLGENRRHLLWIAIQLVTPVDTQPNNTTCAN